MNYLESLAFLGEVRWFGMKLGLSNIERLSEYLGNPHQHLKFIHIAGSNGKGSTAAFCKQILVEHGYKVGLFTSPHLIEVGERIQINHELISNADFAEGMSLIKDLCARVETVNESYPTFFEIITALALWYFDQQKVDYVIWETGLGGLWDATNIVEPEVSIIASIALEHTHILGDTLEKIAFEKAGIIKKEIPVVTAVHEPGPLSVIRQKAFECDAPLTIIGKDVECLAYEIEKGRQEGEIDGCFVRLQMLGDYQIENAACAWAALKKVKILNFNGTKALTGLEKTFWPCRFQIMKNDPFFIIDGSHNPAGMIKTKELCQKAFPDQKFHLVFSSVQDKDFASSIAEIKELAHSVSLVPISANPRACDPILLSSHFENVPTTIYSSLSEAWDRILHTAKTENVLIIGSLFLAGEALGLYQNRQSSSFGMNELLVPSQAYSKTSSSLKA